jgi:uncharacterized delta-60 repeat protein
MLMLAMRVPGQRVVAEAPVAAPQSTLTAQDAVLPVLDPDFAPRFEVEGGVGATVTQPDNKVIIAGAFDAVNGQARRNIARLNADGSLDTTFALSASSIHPTPTFYALALLPDGKVLVGGDFRITGADGRLRRGLVRLHADGTLDMDFEMADVYDLVSCRTIYALALQDDGKILIGGGMTSNGGIARLNPDGSEDESFDPGDGVGGTASSVATAAVRAIALQDDGKILIGGKFTTFDGVEALRIARLNADGSRDADFDVGVDGAYNNDYNIVVNAVTVRPNGDILFGGTFKYVNGGGHAALGCVTPDGTYRPEMSGGRFREVKSILALADNSIIVSGWDSDIIYDGRPLYHDGGIVKRDSAGNEIDSFTFEGRPTEVNALAQRPDGAVVAGGAFRRSKYSVPHLGELQIPYRHSLALFSADLELAFDFEAPVTSAGEVRQILPLDNGDWIALGRFSLVNGAPQVAVAQMTAAGAVAPAFTSPFRRFTNEVYSGVILDDGSLLVGGDYTDNYTDQSLTGQTLVRLSLEEGEILDFPVPTKRAHSPVLAVDDEGRILVGGKGSPGFPAGIKRLLPDGQVDPSFDPGEGLNSPEPDGWTGFVSAILVQADGRIIVAGKFADYGGTGRSTIVRLEENGAIDESFVPPAFGDAYGTPQMAYVMAQQGDPVASTGKLLIGGDFSVEAGAATHEALVRLVADGGLDPTFVSPFSFDDAVRALAVLPDATILAGASIYVELAGGVPDHDLLYLLPNGARHPGFAASVEGARAAATEGAVLALALGVGEQALIGGNFVALDDAPRASMGAYQLQSIPSAIIDPATGGELRVPEDGMVYSFPPGAFSDTVIVIHSPRAMSDLPPVSPLASSPHAFDVTAFYSGSGQMPAQLAPGSCFTVTIAPLDRGVVVSGTAALWGWDEAGAAWSQAGITSTVTTEGGQSTLTAQINHLSLFAVLGETQRVYLLLVLR